MNLNHEPEPKAGILKKGTFFHENFNILSEFLSNFQKAIEIIRI